VSMIDSIECRSRPSRSINNRYIGTLLLQLRLYGQYDHKGDRERKLPGDGVGKPAVKDDLWPDGQLFGFFQKNLLYQNSCDFLLLAG
jgi:hypothetical protein